MLSLAVPFDREDLLDLIVSRGPLGLSRPQAAVACESYPRAMSWLRELAAMGQVVETPGHWGNASPAPAVIFLATREGREARSTRPPDTSGDKSP